MRRYHLEYELTSHVSLLASVQMEGRCSSVLSEGSNGVLGPSSCPRLPGATFDYERIQGSAASALLDSTGREFERINETLLDVPGSPSYSLDEIETSLMDVNADSLPDVVVTAPQLFAGKHGLFLNGSGGRVGFAPAVGMTPTGVSNVDAGVLRLSNSNVTGLDLDADGRIDLVHMPLAKAYSVFTPKQIGSQWTWSGREVTTASGLDPKIDFARDTDRIAVMDVNADGLVDVVFSSATEVQTFFSLGRYPGGDGRFGSATWSGVASAALSDEPISTCSLWSGSPARLGDDDVRVADMNGDGLPDIVRVRSGQVVYWPGRGNGFWGTGERDDCGGGTFGQDREVRMGNAPFVGVVQPGSLLIADVNGDGMSDMVEVRFDAVDVYLNDNGGSFTDRYTVGSVPIKPNGTNPVRLADIDGSGTIDIVWGHGHEYRYIDLAGGKRPHLLRRTSNGLGKTTEFEYATSTELMLAAQAAGKPWSKVMPITTPVIVRATVRDNLDQVGRGAGTYITEYGYRDPVFDGRQREFRGFAVAETRSPGDSTSPSVTTKSTFLLGECEVAHNGSDVCSPANRWQDNWREALKGLPSVVETFDDSGTYLSTNHTGYNLRQLYTGLDGRRVVAAFTAKQESFAYDSASFHASSQQIVLDELDVAVDGISQTETRSVTRRATLGTVRTLSHQAIDNVGNVVSSTARGCVEGCSPIDEEITRSTEFERVAGDESGWMFRAGSSFVTGSAHSTPRQQTRITYNAHGDVVRTSTTLYGTLPLDRSHSAGAAVAPAPPEASGGQSGSVDTVIMEYTHDQFGHVTGIRAAPDRCSSILFDVDYAELAVEETVFGGERGPDGCGRTSFRTTASYDRGLALVTDLVGVTGQPAHQEYDGFGRIISRTLADPEVAGQLGALPTATYAYFLPDNAETHPFARVIERSQDGANPSVPDYMERVAYVDGLGRTLAMLAEADASAGDGGSYVVGGITDYNAKGSAIRSFEPFFWTGDPNAFDLGAGAPSGYASMLYDAFGRPTREYNLSGQIAGQVHYHALSRDVWDAEDLRPGPHWGTYATTVVDGHGRPTRTVERVHVDGTQTLDQRIVLREYLPTGETTRITQRRAGSPDTVRWMRYDSLGRLVLNVEPNTSTGFTPDPEADTTGIRAWRYAYNDAGDLVGTSDARGCGVNYHFDAAGRISAEDYSPCTSEQQAYTPVVSLGASSVEGAEVVYHYDSTDPDSSTVIDNSGRTFPTLESQYLGRVVSVTDRGLKAIVRYDGRGRITGTAVRVAQPGGATPDDPNTFAARWYIQEKTFDAANRALSGTTGATSPQLMGADGESAVNVSYTRRGLVRSVGSSYGPLVVSSSHAADGRPTGTVFGDVAGSQRAYSYDAQRRLRSVQMFRASPELWTSTGYTPASDLTQQLLLEDLDYSYDDVGNIVEISDWRIPALRRNPGGVIAPG